MILDGREKEDNVAAGSARMGIFITASEKIRRTTIPVY